MERRNRFVCVVDLPTTFSVFGKCRKRRDNRKKNPYRNIKNHFQVTIYNQNKTIPKD
jgi:hypothetical protein